MSNVAFLLIVVVVAVVGSVAVWLRNRKPTTFMSSVDDFQQEMRALGREQSQPGGSRRAKGRGPSSPPRGASPPQRDGVDDAPSDDPHAGQ